MADKVITQPNYVVKLKQNRYGEYILEEIRVQSDDMAMLKRRMNAATRFIAQKLEQLNKE